MAVRPELRPVSGFLVSDLQRPERNGAFGGVRTLGNSALSAGGELGQSVIRVRARLGELVAQLRAVLDTLADPQARALFGTTADLLTTLEQAFADVAARSDADPRSDSAPGGDAGQR